MTKKKSNYTSVEKSNLIIALIGCILALISLYFQFIRKKDDLNATLSSFEIGSTGRKNNKIPDLCKLNFVFQNGGNTTFTILYQQTSLVAADTNEIILKRYITQDSLMGRIKAPFILNTVYGSTNDLPIIIKGGEHITQTFYSLLDIENTFSEEYSLFYGLFKHKQRRPLIDTIEVYSKFRILHPNGSIGDKSIKIGWFVPDDNIINPSEEVKSYEFYYVPVQIKEFDYKVEVVHGEKHSWWDTFFR